MTRILFIILALLTVLPSISAFDFRIGRLRYSGGGDWYANASSLSNLLSATRQEFSLKVDSTEPTVSLKDDSAFQVDLLYATGHGNINFTQSEVKNLRRYLEAGGFLWVDDNYGMDRFFRRNIRKVFPNRDLVPLGSEHPLFHSYYKLKGLPKVHEHDGQSAQAFGIFHGHRLIVLYTFSSDIGDGLEDEGVHPDPPEIREQARQFALNLVFYVLNGQIQSGKSL